MTTFGVRVVSSNGGCDTYVEVRAGKASAACKKAQRVAARRCPEYGIDPDTWRVTWLCEKYEGAEWCYTRKQNLKETRRAPKIPTVKAKLARVK